MKSFLFIAGILLGLSLATNSQNLKYQLYDNLGIEQMSLGNFASADSLFITSIELNPGIDAYFNLALSKLNQKDECGFCENMYMASFYGDLEADSLYKQFCITEYRMLVSRYDSLIAAIPNKQYEIIKKDKCDKRDVIDFYDSKDSLLSTLQIIDGRYYYSLLSYKARYPGGSAMLNKFVDNNLIYPEAALEQKIQGKVYASFIVDEEGRVKDVSILSGVHELLDAEARRVIQAIPKWTPATRKGVPIREVVTLNINFSI